MFTSMQYSPLATRRGFTLIEVLVVIVLIGLAAAVIIPRFITSGNKLRANDEVTELQQIVSEVKAKYTSAPTFTGVTLTGLVNLQVFPSVRTNQAAGTAANAFGGVWAVALNAPANDQITLTGGSYPRSVCADVVTNAQAAFTAVSVNAVAVKPAGGALDINATGTNCNADLNTIAWTFTKS